VGQEQGKGQYSLEGIMERRKEERKEGRKEGRKFNPP